MGLPPLPWDVTHPQEMISLPSPSPLAEGSTLESDETTQPGLSGCLWDAQWIQAKLMSIPTSPPPPARPTRHGRMAHGART